DFHVTGVQTCALPISSRLSNPPKSKPGAYRGIFCRASWGKDYHHVLRERLEALKKCLLDMVPTASAEILVDTGPLSDRAVAERRSEERRVGDGGGWRT